MQKGKLSEDSCRHVQRILVSLSVINSSGKHHSHDKKVFHMSQRLWEHTGTYQSPHQWAARIVPTLKQQEAQSQVTPP